MSEYPRGSEWRRWDLHIHTPNTKKNDQFIGTTLEAKWEQYYQDISNYNTTHKENAVVALGITDYLSIDNYLKVVADGKLPESIKLILPNVEMRIQPIAQDSPINIHFLFNPEFANEIESRFFSKITFPYGETNYTANRNELIRLGKEMNAGIDNDLAYKKGIDVFVVSFDSIKKVFDKDIELRKNVIIGVSNSTNDGITGATSHSGYMEGNNSQLKAFRQSIYKFVDVIFSAKPSDYAYFSGLKLNSPPEQVKKDCGSLKACLHGCDAHSNKKILEPDNKRYCWIKADPTFNGLKQVLYEPVERVKISESKPETKANYFVIDKVQYNHQDFQTEPILFSDQLTCIIGGKSTGKSILLQNIAYSINAEEAEKCLSTSKNKTLQVDSMKVFWRDGQAEKRKIIYIPQTYLNKLSDSYQERTEIDKWIQEIIMKKTEFVLAYDQLKSANNDYKITYEKNILDLFSINFELNKLIGERDDIGIQSGIEKEIAELKATKETLSKELNLSEEDLKTYDDTLEKINSIEQKIAQKNNDLILIGSIQTLIEKKHIDTKISGECTQRVLKIQESIIEEASSAWKIQQASIIESIRSEVQELSISLEQNYKIVEPLKAQIQNSHAINELTQKIQTEDKRYKSFLEKDEKIKELSKKKEEIITILSLSSECYKKEAFKYSDLVNGSMISEDGLEFYIEIPFRLDSFISKMNEIFDIRSLKFKAIFNKEDFSDKDYSNTLLSEVIRSILSSEMPLKKGHTQESSIRDLLTNWYNIVYRVKMDNDPIDLMSPGKKALVLLKILISLADSQCPILIDQPEDDLDNRSIYDELIQFIKLKKKERQIIIVTHNANIVLGSDADEIIVANQNGSTSPNQKHRFEYRSGAIENNMPLFDENMAISEGIVNQVGIQQHICNILEGGEAAFAVRKNKYNI